MANHVEIGRNIYWVGAASTQGGLQCNPYLIVDEEEAVLIDPGSVLDIAEVYATIAQLISPEKIKYVILHHQDPDFCAGVPYLENQGLKFQIVTHCQTENMLRYYGIRSEYYLVNENSFRLTLRSGRVFDFMSSPHHHAAGAIMTYDPTSKILFSGDLFGAFSSEWSLFAGTEYMERMKLFHEQCLPSNEILRPALEALLAMDIALIAPQHGSVITDNPIAYIQELRKYEYAVTTPFKKKPISSNVYYDLMSQVLKRLGTLYSRAEVLEAVKGLELIIDEETLEVLSPDALGLSLWCPGLNRWNLLFDQIFTRWGLSWLTAIEPLVQSLSNEYDIPMPQVFQANLKKAKQLTDRLSQENARLQKANKRLQSVMQETENKLNRCPLTARDAEKALASAESESLAEIREYEHSVITPLKEKPSATNGYYGLISRVLKHLGALYSKTEVLEAVKGLDLTIDDETLGIMNPDTSGLGLWNPGLNRWNRLFELILARRGLSWLTVIEPLVQTLCNENDISMPQVFKTNLKKAQQLADRLSQENDRLQEINERLQDSMQETENKLNRCPVTGFYNYSFFRNYLTTEIGKLKLEKKNQDPVFVAISIDNMAQIKFAHGDREVDECLKNFAHILSVSATENSVLFRLQGASFACYWPMVEFEQAVEWAESLKNAVNSAENFIEKISVSLGLVRLSEIQEPGLAPEQLADKLYDGALLRVKVARTKGTNHVVAYSELDSSELKEKKILIVDADPINLDVLSTFFEVLDVEVMTAEDGEEALAIVESQPLAAIITEIMLPKMDGFQLRAELLNRSNTKDIPFILVSYLKNEDSIKRAVSLGIVHYFKKPFMISELTGLLKNKLKG